MADANDFEAVTYDIKDGVGWLTLNRPDVLNAFNAQMQRELSEIWREARGDDSVRVIVLTGAGEKAFCTGIDRTETMGAPAGRADGATGNTVEDRVVGSRSTPFHFDDPGENIGPKSNDLWKPVIAAVNGMACGGAFYMLGEVDIIIAAEHATFFDPHVTYGMAASFESMHMLSKMPLGEVLRIQLLGAHERLSAQRAHQIGLVSEVCPVAELHERAQWVAGVIAERPPLAIQATLRATWAAHELSRSQALALGYAYVG